MLLARAPRFHWPIADPATHDSLPREALLARFRAARDDIAGRLSLLEEEIVRPSRSIDDGSGEPMTGTTEETRR